MLQERTLNSVHEVVSCVSVLPVPQDEQSSVDWPVRNIPGSQHANGENALGFRLFIFNLPEAEVISSCLRIEISVGPALYILLDRCCGRSGPRLERGVCDLEELARELCLVFGNWML